jgi:hypothetical protein
MRDDISNQSLSVLRSHDFSVEISWLGKVAVWMDLFVPSNETLNWKVLDLGAQSHLEISMAVWIVVRLRTLSSLLLRTISLTIVQPGLVRTVDFKLVVIGTESMSMSVGVAEKSSLKHLVERRLDSWHHVGRTVGYLLDLLEVILWVSVQFQDTNFDQRVLAMGPHFGNVEDIPLVILSILFGHHLNTEFPLWIIFSLDGIE